MNYSFLDCLYSHVKTQPNEIAVVSATHQETYLSLWEKAQYIATEIKRLDLPESSIIGLNFQKSSEYLISLLGVWLAGHAFLPLVPELPQSRIQYMIDQANPQLIISREPLPFETTAKELLYSGESQKNDLYHLPKYGSENLAYLIFTSGSSGNPKGVLLPHRGIYNVLKTQIEAFKMSSKSCFLWVLSPLFDASLSDIGTTFLAGGTLVLPPPNLWGNQDVFYDTLAQFKVTHLDLPPVLLNTLKPTLFPTSFQTLIIGGEVASLTEVRKWSHYFRLVNVYGPTETTICSSWMVCSPEWSQALLGRPITGIEYGVFGTDKKQAEQGELYISGKGVGLGYLDKKLTSKKWIFHQEKQWYRTGDHVKKQGQNYLFLGRIDRQMKIQGQLLAPEEIEYFLSQRQIQAALCQSQIQGKNQLIAFIEDPQRQEITLLPHPIWKKKLITNFPIWMLPTLWISCPQLPRTPSHKVDYNQLPIKEVHSLLSSLDTELSHPWEEWFQKILGYSHPDLNFFDAGGSSLESIQLIAMAAQSGIQLHYEILCQNPTPRQLNSWNQKQSDKNKRKAQSLSLPPFYKSTGLSPALKRNTSLLLTGATGFLGSHLLSELLLSYEKITCIVRGTSIKAAKKRVFEVFEKHQLNTTPLEKVFFLKGDITKKYLGQTKEIWEDLCLNIDTIVHSAASVHQLNSYESLYKANVEGTCNVFELMGSGQKKRFHYISTLSVFVGALPCPQICYENSQLDPEVDLFGGYTQSKWVSEKWLESQQKDFDIWIYRLGLITGHSQKEVLPSHDWLQWMSQGLLELKSLPKRNPNFDAIQIDLSPVDWISKDLSTLIETSKPQTYHIANPYPLTLNQYIKELSAFSLTEEPLNDWLSSVKNKLEVAQNPKTATAILALARLLGNSTDFHHSLELFQATHTQFNMKQKQTYIPPQTQSPRGLPPQLIKHYLNCFFKS